MANIQSWERDGKGIVARLKWEEMKEQEIEMVTRWQQEGFASLCRHLVTTWVSKCRVVIGIQSTLLLVAVLSPSMPPRQMLVLQETTTGFGGFKCWMPSFCQHWLLQYLANHPLCATADWVCCRAHQPKRVNHWVETSLCCSPCLVKCSPVGD